MRERSWGRQDRARDESWEDVYRACGVDTGIDRPYGEDTTPAIDAEPVGTEVSGTATPGNDHYDPSRDTFRYRQTQRERIQDPFHGDRPLTF